MQLDGKNVVLTGRVEWVSSSSRSNTHCCSSSSPQKLGANFDVGVFDLSVAVFLFNCMPITAMNETFEDVYSLLKPGEFAVSLQADYLYLKPVTPKTRDRSLTSFCNCYFHHFRCRRSLCLQCSSPIHGISQLCGVWIPGEQ